STGSSTTSSARSSATARSAASSAAAAPSITGYEPPNPRLARTVRKQAHAAAPAWPAPRAVMSIFRRREPLHVKLARESGIDLDGSDTREPRPPWDGSVIHGNHRARQWDVVTTAVAPDLPGDRIGFVALPGGELVAEEGGGDLSVLAEALDFE